MRKKSTALTVTQIALMAALCFAGFFFCSKLLPSFSVGGFSVTLHIGNMFCILGALLLGGWQGGLAGSIGMTIADLLDPRYITSAPKTFILKFLMGLICGLLAHKVFKIAKADSDGHLKSAKQVLPGVIVSGFAGLLFNVIFEPVVSYLYSLLLGMDKAFAYDFALLQLSVTGINALIAVICSTLLYTALRPALIRAHLFTEK